MISSFPKIFAIGTRYIQDIFIEEVEVTEKIDGSQFSFGKVQGEIFLRSKGAQLYIENPEKMFAEAISYVDEMQDRLPEGIVFYAEYLKKPKHNVLKYDRVPKNHLILFGVMHVNQEFKLDLPKYAELLGIEHVPVLFRGKIETAMELSKLLDTESILGGTKVEGVVVKNFERQFLLGGVPMPLMAGKFVSETYKEVHRGSWGKEHTGKGKMDVFFDSFRTPARWEKAVQHLTEQGVLVQEPKDIGLLIKEVHRDIEEEEKEEVKTFLWREFGSVLKRRSTAGMPEWYKNKLMESVFKGED